LFLKSKQKTLFYFIEMQNTGKVAKGAGGDKKSMIHFPLENESCYNNNPNN